MTLAKTYRMYVALSVVLGAYILVAPAFADQGDTPGRAARLSYTRGSVSLQVSGENQWSQASPNSTVTTGDRLYTDQGSRAELEVGPFAVRMSETTDLTMANLNDQLMQLGLAQGAIRVSVYQLPSGNSVEIDTPNGALTVLGPGRYRVDTDPNNGYTVVSVNSGSLEVTGGGTNQTVGSGEAVQLTGTGPIQIASVSPPGTDDFDQWSMGRDRRIESSVSARYASRYMPGFEDLDDYGRWRATGDYGQVWYPSGVPPDWVPYRYGSWGWVEPWGWTWVEDEPWGFCPFHYGRWAFISGAWGWVPGPVAVAPMYSPALVAFVGGGGFSLGFGLGNVAAWFPLGPGEPFVPWYHYSPGYLRQVNVTNVRNVTNITNITNVTNVNNINYANRTVATTAVPATVLKSGLPVARQAVHVSPQQVARAQVIAHPSIAPAPRIARGGKPAPPPQIRAPRITAARQMAGKTPVQGAPGGARPAPLPSAPGRPSQSQPPLVTRNAPPAPGTANESRPAPPSARASRPSEPQPPLVTRNAPAPGTPNESRPAPPSPGASRPSQSQPPLVTRNAPPEQRTPNTSRPLPNAAGPSRAPTQRPPLVTRSTPPPQSAPFERRQPALQAHPGRPLEPQQRANLQAGRPAGPMRDREVLPHPSPPNQAKSVGPPTRPGGEAGAVPRQRPRQ